ncbi:MAG: ribonucleoside-diphosphate reductase subunit alpha [Chlamydiales bacterium]|nr:ribonucleoside-diphosphate reductase subunit alpha [Chlamydiales bacterium]
MAEETRTTKTEGYTIVKRNGMLVPFRRDRILHALEAAFRDTKKTPHPQPLLEQIRQTMELIADLVVEEAVSMASMGVLLTVEGIQDIVEIKLMETGHHDVARDYIVYRDQHKKLRKDSPRALKILRRDGVSFVRFNPMKIASALERGFRDTLKIVGPTPSEVIESVNLMTNKIVDFSVEEAKNGTVVSIEMIQDAIERTLMEEGYYQVAKDFILYRARAAAEREKHKDEEIHYVEEEGPGEEEAQFSVVRKDGTHYKLGKNQLRKTIAHACKGYEKLVSAEDLVSQAITNYYDGIKDYEVDLANIMAARAKVEIEPAYTYVAANLLLDVLYREALGIEAAHPNLKKIYKKYFKEYFRQAVSHERLDPTLLSFDLDKLADALVIERDKDFTYLGLQTLYDRYFIHHQDRRLETPQILWMRVAMGLAMSEGKQKEERAIEFYNTLSRFLYVSATPTLFNSGTNHSQLSSCYLSTVMDDLSNIYKIISDDAQLSKWAGGLGNDWTNVRATGSMIKGTNGRSQGVIPFLKVANDTAVAVNQGGKRKGAMCAYLETWHLDIEDFLELRKNTGDERRRTHDMNTANWIPDLFMKRVERGEMWTLFSPSDVPDLHDLYGNAFEKKYCAYEKMTETGEIKLFKRVEAVQLWRKMLGMLYETGHPWITFKDPSNIRSPQDHAGVVHSSNLCTEILLNTSVEETAVCNLGSINLPAHIKSGKLDKDLLASTIRTAVRMLDNVIDINFYPIEEARRANLRHRAIGLGLMGFQDALYELGISYASHEAVDFADKSMEMISYYAILASSELAKERGPYLTYKGSKWDRGILPIDSIRLLAQERGKEYSTMDSSASLDWSPVRDSIKKHGMRNCNTMAIAPTATISNITGITQSIEPMYKHLFVKSNLSGEFTILNPYLVNKLKELDLWDAEMVDDLKYFDGSVLEIERIPDSVKKLFPTAFEVDPDWIIECASRRQKWIDMGQSLNLYLAEPSGKKLNDMYFMAWKKGLKTTYYLRSLGATHVEKSTTDINKRGLQPRWMRSESASSRIVVDREMPKACGLDDESCESCQ